MDSERSVGWGGLEFRSVFKRTDGMQVCADHRMKILSCGIASRVIINLRGAVEAMRFKVILSALFVGFLVQFVAAQPARTITNADLEKFRNERLKAEKEYNENYERLGFPSPEELQRQIEKSRAEREALAARLAAERLRQEQAEAERAQRERLSNAEVYFVSDEPSTGQPVYWIGGRGTYHPRFPRVRQFSPNVRIGNGIPVVDYYQNRSFRPPRPAFDVPGRRPLR